MNTTDKELAATEVALLADIVRELEALSEQGTLTAGTARLPLVKIENIVKRIRRELPQLPNNNNEGNKMTYIETVEKLKVLDQEVKAFDRSFAGDWRARNLPENLAKSDRLNSEILKLNATIGYSFYQ